MPGFSVLHHLPLLKLMSIDSAMPSNHLVLCFPSHDSTGWHIPGVRSRALHLPESGLPQEQGLGGGMGPAGHSSPTHTSPCSPWIPCHSAAPSLEGCSGEPVGGPAPERTPLHCSLGAGGQQARDPLPYLSPQPRIPHHPLLLQDTLPTRKTPVLPSSSLHLCCLELRGKSKV